MDPGLKKFSTKVKAHSDAVNSAYERSARVAQKQTQGSINDKRYKEARKLIKKPKVKVTSRCRCGDLLTYHCVVQCEKCWAKVVEQFELEKVEQAAQSSDCAPAWAHQAAAEARARREATWTPAAGSAAAAAAANSAPTLGPVPDPVQRKVCPCGRLINNIRYDKCFHCNAKDKQLKAAADADSDKLLESLKREVADKQRELAKLQLKEADQAFERTQQAVDAGSYGEDSQSD